MMRSSIRAVLIVFLVLAIVGSVGVIGTVSADSCSSLEGTEYEGDCDDLQEHIEAINESVTDLEQLLDDQEGDLSLEAIESANEDLETLETQLKDLDSEYTNLSADLLDENVQLAVQSSADIETMVTDVQSDADTVIEQYDEEVATQESSYRSSIWLFFGGSFVIALVLGAVAGTVLPYQLASSIRERQRIDSDFQYGYEVALVPVGIGTIVFIIGVAILWYANGLQAIGGLI